MKIDGAAYVTVASQIAYAMASLWYFNRKNKNYCNSHLKNAFLGNHWSRFFCDADAGDDTGTAKRTL